MKTLDEVIASQPEPHCRVAPEGLLDVLLRMDIAYLLDERGRYAARGVRSLLDDALAIARSQGERAAALLTRRDVRPMSAFERTLLASEVLASGAAIRSPHRSTVFMYLARLSPEVVEDPGHDLAGHLAGLFERSVEVELARARATVRGHP